MKISNRTSIIVSLVGVCIALMVSVWFFGATPSPGALETPLPENPSKESTLIIAFGDSLTAGYGLPLSESYPAILESRLKEKGLSVKVVNSGVSGETTKGNTERASFIRAQNPDIVLLGIGGNDALRFLSIDETELNIRKTIETLQAGENAPQIILLQMQAPLNAGKEYKDRFDSLYAELSTTYGLTRVPFYTEEVFLNTAYKLADGIHFNKAGYTYIVDTYLLEEVVKLIQKKD